MRSKGRSRPMSATLTPERKSARDRPASSNERPESGGLGERKREVDRRARGQQARAHSGTDSHPEGQYRTPLHRGPAPCMLRCAAASTPSQPMTPPPPSPSIIRRALLLPPPAPLPSCLSHPTDTTASLLLPPPLCRLCAAIDATPESVANARACVRNGGRSVWRAPQKRHRPLLPPTRQPPLLPGRKLDLT